ncbi:MAG TPA: Pr6Pr family membrane protein [Luteibacter sp.]|nr:Pr6Pr family membrane protein [Luteibacter sp.]
MSPRTAAISNLFAIVVAAVAWPALMLQYWLSMWSDSQGMVLLRFFSFFTILSNVLVGLVATSAAMGGNWGFLRFWRGPRVRGLAALSITVTCLIYATLLQSLWHPLGPQLIADRSLHYVVPVLYLVWWIALLPHGTLVWRDAACWLGFPLVFAVWTFIRGAIMHEYPYPFMDVDKLGYGAVLVNSALVGVLFLVLGLAFVALDRLLGRRAAMA